MEGGVEVERVVADQTPLPRRFEPGHPDADAAGYVSYPNVNPVLEMTDLLSAVRSYQLNAAAVQAAKSMIQQSLQILS
jgi:flagellar basal-body rod protein FlgC